MTKPDSSQSKRVGEEIVSQMTRRHTDGYGRVHWDDLIRDVGARYVYGALTLQQMEAAIHAAMERVNG